MADYFTRDHFELLNKWKGWIYDKTNAEQQKAYEELREAFDVTKRWAEAVQQKSFPVGRSKTVRRPTDQWQKKFIPYNWGRIYPSSDSPKELAYTVGIDAVLGFVVKIDVVDTQTEDSTLRPKYEAIRGPFTASPIVAILPATDGLGKSLSELVVWSVDAIRNFRPRYDDLVAQLNLGKAMSDEDLLKHFDTKPAFQTFRASWAPQDKALFCRLARAVHAAGLDWWHMRNNIQVGFGRKNPGSERAVVVLGVIRGTQARKITWTRPLGTVANLNRELLTQDLVEKIEASLSTERKSQDDWLVLETERPGLWPDQLRDDPADPGEEADDEAVSDAGAPGSAINRIFYGPPGTGKTYTVSKLLEREYDYQAGPPASGAVRRYSFVTFHQSYGYEEFVEGLRPLLGNDAEAGDVQYEIRPGVFKDLCRRARSAPDQRFAMVIDEINRGNISKIFGELITLIEPDKREGAENALAVTLPYTGDNFSVPGNVDIIGTMNTADRSLALLDTALRRRFEFVPVMPDARDEPGAPLAGLRVSSGEQIIEVPRMLGAINQRVEALYDRDHCIGHAYFASLAKVPDGDERLIELQQVFSTRILPLLEEYFFEDWQKIRLVLADNQKPAAAQFVMESLDHEDDLARLFGGGHGLDSYVTKRRYAVQEAAFSNPAAYIGIYQTLPA